MINRRTAGAFLAQLPCFQFGEAPEIFGPTDINSQSANGSLAVAFNRQGTMTVLRWPRPSFYDQLKYHTTGRDEPRMGAAVNAGAFLGLALETEWGPETEWLREWESEQRYVDDFSDTIETVYREDGLALDVRVRDTVAPDTDALHREVEISRDANSPVESVRLVAFENCNLVVTKEAGNPVQDWCRESENTDRARYDGDADAIVHGKEGTDESTGERRRVAIAMGFDRASAGHQVGTDAHEPAAGEGPRDAYEDADAPGRLSGAGRYVGHTTGALSAPLDLSDGDSLSVLFAAGETGSDAREVLREAREREDVVGEKRDWFDGLLDDPPMPATDDDAVRSLAARALVTLVSNYDRESGAIVASVATQAPYGLDWPRDGAYFNHLLDALGLGEWVAKRNRWYADLQADEGDDIPAGTWGMNYYADGVLGGPIPYEIDEVAYAVWTLHDHYTVSGDEEYLEDVWPAIERGADFLVSHRDPETGLHAAANEDDNVVPAQSVVGAGPIHLALRAAADAADERGEGAKAETYRERAAELASAIEEHLWDPERGAYTRRYPSFRWAESLPVLDDLFDGLPLLPAAVAEPAIKWPVGFDAAGERLDAHLEHLWVHIAETFREPHNDERQSGLYEAQGLVSLARAWRGEERFERVQCGVRWIAREHATADTNVMGEVWMQHDGEIVTTVSQPHTWAQVLFYVAAIEAFPPEEVPDGENALDYYRQ